MAAGGSASGEFHSTLQVDGMVNHDQTGAGGPETTSGGFLEMLPPGNARYRILVLESHLVLYRNRQSTIEVHRVVHGLPVLDHLL